MSPLRTEKIISLCLFQYGRPDFVPADHHCSVSSDVLHTVLVQYRRQRTKVVCFHTQAPSLFFRWEKRAKGEEKKYLLLS